MSAIWKTDRVIIIITFRDMHAERDHLVTVVFQPVGAPSLAHLVGMEYCSMHDWCPSR